MNDHWDKIILSDHNRFDVPASQYIINNVAVIVISIRFLLKIVYIFVNLL